MSLTLATAIRALITVILLSGTGGLIVLLATVAIPEENAEHVWTLLGIVGTLTTQSVMWWFGSSKGSADKTDALIKYAPPG